MILGDLTDAKDRHSASLVNRVVENLAALSRRVPDITILAGNHDWLLKGHEFFRFLNQVPGIRFITNPTEETGNPDAPDVLYLPYSKDPAKDWAGYDLSIYDYLFMHQTIKGAVASNGEEMTGENLPELNAKRMYSGDIHVPQTIKGITYVGSPYHVHFGDDFKPRVLLLDRREREHWLHFKTPRRMSVTVTSLKDLQKLDLQQGDHIKLKFKLGAADKHSWSKIKREAAAIVASAGVSLEGLEMTADKQTTRLRDRAAETKKESPESLIERFVVREEWGADALDAAMEIMES